MGNIEFVTKKLTDAGFSVDQAYMLLDKVEESYGENLKQDILDADKDRLGEILKTAVLPTVQSVIQQDMQEFPEEADLLATRAGNLAKGINGAEWNREKFLKTLGRQPGEDGVAHIGALNDGDYINLRLNGLNKKEADSLADKYRQEYQQMVAEQEKALEATRMKNAALQSLADDTDWKKDKRGFIVGNVIAPRAVKDIENQIREGKDVSLSAAPLAADLGESFLMFSNPVGKVVAPAARVVGNGIKAVRKLNNPLAKYGAKAAGEAATGAVSDGILDLGAEGVASLSDDYDMNLDNPVAVTASAATLPSLIGSVGGFANQFAGGRGFFRGITDKIRRGEKTPTVQKMALEQKANWVRKKEAEAENTADKIAKQNKMEGARKYRKELESRYPDYMSGGYTDADNYAGSLIDKADKRAITRSEMDLLGVKPEEFRELSEVAGEAIGSVLSPASQISARGYSVTDAKADDESYKETAWYKHMNKDQREKVDEAMKKERKQ